MRIRTLTVRWLLLCALFLSGAVVLAQGGNNVKPFKPDIKRSLFHEYIDKSQRAALRVDGTADNQFTLTNDDEINYLVTDALTNAVDSLQYKIEKDSLIDHRHKVAYLIGMD